MTQGLSALNAERIKLSTIRSPLWSCVAAAVLGLGVAALQGSSAYGAASLSPDAVRRFDAALQELLATRFPLEPLRVPHRVFALIGRTP